MKAILALKRVGGLYAGALIKKRRYWPTLVHDAAMDTWFQEKSVGDVDAIQGIDSGTPYFIWGMKEPDYVMRIMAVGGALVADNTCKTAFHGEGTARMSFKYTKPFDWHFRFRHLVDDHNNLRHSLPNLEGTWITECWPIHVFSFLLAISEVK